MAATSQLSGPAPSAASIRPGPSGSRAEGRRAPTSYQGAAWAFMAPATVLVVLALYLPVVYTVYLSFTSYSGLGSPELVGVENYVEMFADTAFLTALTNTLVWVVGSLLVPVGIGLLVAYLSFGLRFAAWLRIPFLVPYALSGVAVGVVFSFVLQNDGALSQALAFLHLPGSQTRWLQEAPLNTVVMILAASWQGIDCRPTVKSRAFTPIPCQEAARIMTTVFSGASCSQRVSDPGRCRNASAWDRAPSFCSTKEKTTPTATPESA
jgi:ABC-type sugar transport system permease subunit